MSKVSKLGGDAENQIHGDECIDDCDGCPCWCHPGKKKLKLNPTAYLELLTEAEKYAQAIDHEYQTPEMSRFLSAVKNARGLLDG